MTALATIGYQGATLDGFIAALRDAGISVLIDVRDAPVSRKAGFSKNALAAGLEAAGIDYVHLRALGNPKAGRDAARAGDIATYHRLYFARLATPEAESALERAAALAADGAACLMCFERDAAGCHRLFVAAALAERAGFEIRHLAPGGAGSAQGELALDSVSGRRSR